MWMVFVTDDLDILVGEPIDVHDIWIELEPW